MNLLIWQLRATPRGGCAVAKKSFRFSKQIFCVIYSGKFCSNNFELWLFWYKFDYFWQSIWISHLEFCLYFPCFLIGWFYDESVEEFVTWISVSVHVHILWYSILWSYAHVLSKKWSLKNWDHQPSCFLQQAFITGVPRVRTENWSTRECERVRSRHFMSRTPPHSLHKINQWESKENINKILGGKFKYFVRSQ